MRERQRNYGRPQEPSNSQFGRGGPTGYNGGRGRGRGGYQNNDDLRERQRNYGRDHNNQNYGDNRSNNLAYRNPYERDFHRSDPRQYQSLRDQNSRRPEPPREEYSSRTPQEPPKNPPPVLLGEFKPSEVRQETLSGSELYFSDSKD